MKNITASLVNMYQVCKREMWLHAHQVNMEQTSDTVSEGKLIGETTYLQRAERYTEVELAYDFEHGMRALAKIDFFDAKNKIVHETKKSNKLEHAHIAQVRFYLYLLEKNGVVGCSGKVEYPKLRQTLDIEPLTTEQIAEIETCLQDIQVILAQDKCPELVKKSYCKTCSYYDFCYVE
jgi:CRISPR-associated exonuclease Cas4